MLVFLMILGVLVLNYIGMDIITRIEDNETLAEALRESPIPVIICFLMLTGLWLIPCFYIGKGFIKLIKLIPIPKLNYLYPLQQYDKLLNYLLSFRIVKK